MMIYSYILIIFRYVPYLLNVIKFYNLDDIKYGIISGYISESFIQSEILYPFIYGILGIICLLCLIIVLIFSLFKRNMIRIIGMTVISQSISLIVFQAWSKYFVDSIGDTITIDVKVWLVIVLIIMGGVYGYLLNKKYFIFC